MRCSALVWLLIAALGPAAASAAEHVVLVSIDGFAAYHLYDQQLELPNIRSLIREGVWASSSETVFPSVTHPSHTTMLTGVEPRLHGVLSNRLRNRETGESFHPTNKPRTEIVRVPTLFDLAKEAGLSTASFFWPETRDDPAVDFNIPEVLDADNKAEPSALDPRFAERLEEAGVPIHLYYRWYGTERQGAGDLILAEAAAHVIRSEKPNLLAIHILVTDKAQHDYGPHHYLAKAALTMADACVGILRQALEDAGVGDQSVIIVTADHGFHSVSHELNVRPFFERAGLLDRLELAGGGWSLAVRLKESFEPATDLPRLEKVFEELRANPYVARIVGPDELHALGQPRYEESPYAFGHYLVIPDIDTYLVSEPGDSTERRPRPEASHSHGYLPQHPRMHTSLVLWGDGVRRGETIGHVRNLDIAPTIAELLDLDLEQGSGRALEEALQPEGKR